MSVTVYAFVEYKSNIDWLLFTDMNKKYHEPGYNLAPTSWGNYNFTRYYEQSREKGLPDDLSSGIQKIIEQQQADWGDDVINRPSWISLQEILDFYLQDTENRYAHFDFEFLQQLKEKLNQDIRVVFWAN
jgi:hypothetical protein